MLRRVVYAPEATERSSTICRRSICTHALASCLLLPRAPNGCTYAGNRLESHDEVFVGGVESSGARMRVAELVKVVDGWTEVDVRVGGVTGFTAPSRGPSARAALLGAVNSKTTITFR
jgi:hypothetical protein